MAVHFTPDTFRYPLGIWQLKRTLDRTQWLSEAELQAFQDRKAVETVRHAWEQVPYYRRLFRQAGIVPSDIRAAEHLRRIPILDKPTLRQDSKQFLAEDAARYHPRAFYTSGTTGSPIELYHGKHANMLEFVYYWRYWGWAGYRLGDRFVQVASLAFLKDPHLRGRLYKWQPHLGRLLLNSIEIRPERAEEIAGLVRRYRCRFLKGLSATLYFLALCTRDAGIGDLAFQAVFGTGEALTPKIRRTLGEVFHGHVIDSYGHMERTVGICQCPKGGYHVNADYGLLQVENPHKENGSTWARIIGTTLHSRAMPLIRYDVGDDVELFETPPQCPCGRTLPLVKGVRGRREDAVVTPDGRSLHAFFAIAELVQGADFIQFLQESTRRIEILVVPNRKWSDTTRLKLESYVRQAVGPDMTIRTREVAGKRIQRDPSGKIRAVISNVVAP